MDLIIEEQRGLSTGHQPAGCGVAREGAAGHDRPLAAGGMRARVESDWVM